MRIIGRDVIRDAVRSKRMPLGDDADARKAKTDSATTLAYTTPYAVIDKFLDGVRTVGVLLSAVIVVV
ncbi:hypothetical protein Trydic_g12707 [Trypoxylus dichotomus]